MRQMLSDLRCENESQLIYVYVSLNKCEDEQVLLLLVSLNTVHMNLSMKCVLLLFFFKHYKHNI